MNNKSLESESKKEQQRSSSSSSSSMRPRTLLYQQRVKFIENRLRDNFPQNYVYFHAALLIFSGILGILLQVALIINQEPMYEYGQGVWAGTACLMIAVSALLLGKTHILCFIFSVCFHTLGFMVIFAGYILINSLKLAEGATINNELMIVIGIMAGFLCLVFPIRMSISIFGVNQKHFKAYSESVSATKTPATKNPDIDMVVKELPVIDEEKTEESSVASSVEQIA